MMGDPFMMSHNQASGGQEVDGKETLHFNGFILVPPPPHAPPRSTREKPPGCKTLIIGGLPETVSEEMIGELMQTCGSMYNITSVVYCTRYHHNFIWIHCKRTNVCRKKIERI